MNRQNPPPIEPSEILTHREGPQRSHSAHVNPWIRFLARYMDYGLFFLLLGWLRALTHGALPFGKFEHLVPFEFFAWIPCEAAFLSTWGKTPGKYFLKTSLMQGKKTRLDLPTAIRRSFKVWFRGLGMGIPVIDFFCLFVAYQRLQVLKRTTWDRDENIAVAHTSFGKWRFAVAAAFAALSFFSYYSEKILRI